MRAKYLGNISYALGIIDDFTDHSEVYILADRGKVYEVVCEYMERSERVTVFRLQSMRLDGSGEHKIEIVSVLKRIQGIFIKISPPYSLQRNGRAERFMQEISLRFRDILTGIGIPDALWEEAMHHGKWIRNILPSKRIYNNLPLRIYRPNAKIIYFVKLPTFGEPGFYLSIVRQRLRTRNCLQEP